MRSHSAANGSSQPTSPILSIASRYGAVVALVVAAALWGLGGTVASELFRRGANPLEVVALRTWVCLIGLTVLWGCQRQRRPAGPVPWLIIIGFGLAVAVANSALFLAISKLPVAAALVLQNLAPVFVIGWSLAVTRRPPAGRVIVGLVAALVGVAFVVQLPTVPIGSINVPGVLFGLLTAAGVAAFSALGGRAAQACGAVTANTYAFAVSSVVWLLYQLPHGLPGLIFHPTLLWGTIAIGLLGTLAPFVLYSWGTARLGPQVGAVNICLEPLFGAVGAWLWLGQTLTLAQIAGGVVLLVAVIDMQRTRSPGKRPGVAGQDLARPAGKPPGRGSEAPRQPLAGEPPAGPRDPVPVRVSSSPGPVRSA